MNAYPGPLVLAAYNGQPRFECQVTHHTKITVNKFDKNGLIHIHINRRGKAISIPLDEMDELIPIINDVKTRIHMLDQVSIIYLDVHI